MSGPWQKYQKAEAAPEASGPWTKYAQPAPVEKDSDHYVGATKAVLFGARPFVAGVGGNIGQAMGDAGNENLGLKERLLAIPKALLGFKNQGYYDAKEAALAEEADLAQRRPGFSTTYDVVGGLATAPLIAGRALQTAAKGGGLLSGVRSSAKIGAALGAADALGHAENANEAIEKIGGGAVLGGALQIGGNALPKAVALAGRGAKKLGSTLTGIPEKEIQTLFDRSKEVMTMSKNADKDIALAADTAREKIMRDIQVKRQGLSNQISETLSGDSAKTMVDGSAILKAIDDKIAAVSKVSQKFRPDEVNELKNIRDLVASTLSKPKIRMSAGGAAEQIEQGGKISVQDLFHLKEELQKIAKPSYKKGQIFVPGDLASKSSSSAAKEARRLLNKASPDIAQANNQLSMLHGIEDVMNKNLITAGKPEAALLAAGSGSNSRNLRNLGRLDKITGGDAVRQAENLAAMRSFQNPAWLATDATGKVVGRMAAGAALGYAAGGTEGAGIGMALTSPAALKLAVTGARMTKALGLAAGSGLAKALPQTPVGTGRAAILSQGIQRTGEGPAVDSAVNRRLRFLEKGRNTKPGSGQ